MNSNTLVCELTNHNIYFINNGTISYYIGIPKNNNNNNNNNNFNIAIDFKGDTSQYDFKINDSEWVKNNLINTYKAIDESSSAIVIPMLSEEEKKLFNVANEQNFMALEKMTGNLINDCFKTLINNKIPKEQIDAQIFLIEEAKAQQFNVYFSNKHSDRIIIKSTLNLLQNNNTLNQSAPNNQAVTSNNIINNNELKPNSVTLNNQIANNQTLQTPNNITKEINDNFPKEYTTITPIPGGPSFVTGRIDDIPEEVINNVQPLVQVNPKVRTLTPPPPNINVSDKLPENSGFVSYIVTFIISAFAVFLILYIIIK